ncbi:MAG: patatin-like phospholipase family protein [Aquihabitans sp.]
MDAIAPEPDPTHRDPAKVRVGLVLGAGGVVGQAFHAGVLAALEHDLGWDVRSADVIVGTSAGSVSAAALRMGVRGLDLAAATVALEPSLEGRPFLDALDLGGSSFPAFELRRLLRRWRLPSPRLVARIARRPWAFRPTVAALTLVPDGWVDLAEHADAIRPLLGSAWPDGLRICTARSDTGARVVFGAPGGPTAPLDLAVSASCAIPGYFRPVDIGGASYIDGGVHSPTSADVLRDDGLDLVIVSSPMSAVRGRALTPDAGLRWSNHRRLQREVNRLRRAGVEVVAFEPTGRVLAAMGINAMASDRSDRVMRAAFFAAGAYALQPEIASALARIASRPRRARSSEPAPPSHPEPTEVLAGA